MSVKSSKDVTALRKIGTIVATVLHEVSEYLAPGVTTGELDALAAGLLARRGARSAPKLCFDFPGHICISINEEAAHGIPGRREIKAGDLVNIDVSAELDGYFADTGASFPVASVPPVANKLCDATQKALRRALDVARAGTPIREIEKIYRKTARQTGFDVIQTLTGHGVGRHIHEYPEYVPNFGNLFDKRRFREGLVVTLEPFFSTGGTHSRRKRDGWTETLPAGKLSAQYEHTIIIQKGYPIVTTALA